MIPCKGVRDLNIVTCHVAIDSEAADQLSKYMRENFVETDEERAARIKQV